MNAESGEDGVLPQIPVVNVAKKRRRTRSVAERWLTEEEQQSLSCIVRAMGIKEDAALAAIAKFVINDAAMTKSFVDHTAEQHMETASRLSELKLN